MVSSIQEDKRGKFIEYKEVKYRLWVKRDLYCSQVGGQQRFLHRVLWETLKAPIPKGYAVVPKTGDWHNFDISNWVCDNHAKLNGKLFESVNECRLHNGVKYYKRTDGYYQNKSSNEFLHRAVYRDCVGAIPEGYHVHHLDHDKENNDSSNLQCISASNHSEHHAKTNCWVGSEGNKMQLIEAGKKAAEIRRGSKRVSTVSGYEYKK